MRYLICIDNSNSSIQAFNKCVSILKKNEDEVFLLSVAEDVSLGYSSSPFIDVQALSQCNEGNRNLHKEVLQKFGSYCKNHNINATLLLGHGTANQVICDEVEKRKIDVVVVGRRGISDLKRVFMGSTSKYLVDNSNVTVLVVKEKKETEVN
eukprot:TRINITY_DN3822_c0_g1_i1.p1 TRINITY_DN3822_c0_g1~~TRINITY_DN3822_c0_g1_i1.p1  ORF type:complete len:152 (-),score=39.39 TRINITY_DN3822_c0_g1_i1:66-521(-)